MDNPRINTEGIQTNKKHSTVTKKMSNVDLAEKREGMGSTNVFANGNQVLFLAMFFIVTSLKVCL